MDDQDRVNFIRRGNELFNQGDVKNALKLFLATDYKDGIIRVADILYYEKKDRIAAIKLYKRAGYQKMIDEFAETSAQIIRVLLAEDQQAAAAASIPERAIAETESPSGSPKVESWQPVTLSIEDLMKLDSKKDSETKGK